ncbi:hypothetical protein F5X96DRAFT_6576 [Biscogniauxia mediterranea]|nr:hypothetical protein F5X96DRAFT_6576 [Biscogniauxia mediterranea]
MSSANPPRTLTAYIEAAMAMATTMKSIAVEADLSATDGPKKLAATASEAFGRSRHPRQQRRFIPSFICDIAELSEADLERAWGPDSEPERPGHYAPPPHHRTPAVFLLFVPRCYGSKRRWGGGGLRSCLINFDGSTPRDPDPGMMIYV